MDRIVNRKKFPRDLEGKLGAVLNITNSELKVLTLLHLDDTAVTGSEIMKMLSLSSQNNYITPLLKMGEIRKERDERIVRYYIK